MNHNLYILVDDCILVANDQDAWKPTRIDDTTVNNSRVSTVFLGMEHIGGMFETMIFNGPADGFMIRCETAKEARAQHNKVVEVLQSIHWLHWYLNGNLPAKICQQLDEELQQ